MHTRPSSRSALERASTLKLMTQGLWTMVIMAYMYGAGGDVDRHRASLWPLLSGVLTPESCPCVTFTVTPLSALALIAD